jgi:DNA-directed RNA polymerase sigma subunit (sigma70/sigma32)
VCDLYNSGKSMSQIAKIYKCTSRRIRNILVNNNVKLKPKHIVSREQYTNALKLDIDYFKLI